MSLLHLALLARSCPYTPHFHSNDSVRGMSSDNPTASVYTAAEIFPMLPERLSTELTSLNENADRLSIVVEMVIGADGSLQGADVYRALVRNHAKLAYNRTAAWLEGRDTVPAAVAAVNGLADNLRIQDRVAQTLKNLRQVVFAATVRSRSQKSNENASPRPLS